MKSPASMPSHQSASLSDAELVVAARNGDKRAFVEIVARHQAMVCGVALGILGDFAASEDAGQEAFLTAWRKLHELREPERLRAWLGQVARNAALGHLRRKREHAELDEGLALADNAPGPAEVAATEEEAALVRESLAKLPENYRLPLILYYREGQSIRAVADALELSEDAVKQRLARGREMLRERMAGVIEGVLNRTRPTAVFTMAIAAAIGALATPSAVAASAFAGASAAGASATTSSAASLFTAMSTSKAFLAAAAVVAFACVPIGYHWHSAGTPAEPANTPQLPPAETITARPKAAPSFEDSALFAEWRGLHAQYGTNASAMPVLYQAIADLKDPFRRRAFHAALIAEWVQVDAPGGLKFILGKGPDATQRQQFVEEWLARDPNAAIDSLLASGKGWAEVARECLPEIARRAPARVPAVASRLPKSDNYWDTNVRDAFALLAESGLESARKAAETVTGPSRDEALAGIARVWARSDFHQAVAWAKALSDGTDRDEIIRAALLSKAALDPAGALELAGMVPGGGRHGYFATTTGARVLAGAAETDFDATVAWLAAHPGRFGPQDLEGLASAATDRLNADPAGFLAARAADGSLSALQPALNSALLNHASGQRAAVWDWLKTQPESEPVKELREDVLHSAAFQDPALAMRLVADLPRGREGDDQVQLVAQCLLNGTSRLRQLDQLLSQAPKRLRQPLVDAAFSCLNPASLDDPQTWVQRIAQVPETSRQARTEGFANAWAAQSPEDAVRWINSLPSGNSRSSTFAAVASGWASEDAHGAAEWVASLPPGTDRDRSAHSLVLAVADQYPREAWDWALSISNPAHRSHAAARALKAMATRDQATARQWLQAGPFTPETRTELEAALARTKAK